MGEHRIAEANTHFRRMLKILLASRNNFKDGSTPEIQMVTTNLIISLRGMGQHAEALKQLKIILALNPNWEMGQLISAVLLIELGNIQSAVDIIQTIPPDIIAELPESIPIIGSAYSAINMYQESINFFFSIIHRSRPEDKGSVQIALIGLIRGFAQITDDFEKTETIVLNFIEKIKEVNPETVDNIDLQSLRYNISRHLCLPETESFSTFSTQASIKTNSGDGYGLIYSGKSMRIPETSLHSTNIQNYVSPEVDPLTLQNNILTFQEVIKNSVDKGSFDNQLKNIAILKNKNAPDAGDPIIVLSTGRCGTGALHNFFEDTQTTESYHNFHTFPAPCDRNHLLYRIISKNFDETIISKILKNYLECRTAEILFAYINNKTPIIVSHWDTVFAPFIATLFTNSRFLYVKRNEYDVCTSIFSKNQWRNRQLQHWLYDPDFPDGNFVYARDEKRDIGQEIAWYLYITETYSHAFLQNLTPSRRLEIRSEDLFSQSKTTFSNLNKWAPDLRLNYDLYRRIFTAPKNRKDNFKMYADKYVSKVCGSVITEFKKLIQNNES